MFHKILVANRGAIAVRVFRTLGKLGVVSVAVYADADRDSLHVSLADEAYSLGPGGASDTYLDQEKLFDICEEAGVDAIHPGYGFLSENPEFVEACVRRGIAFLGPTPAQIRAFGLKHTARELARSSKVPLLPGTEILQSLDEALQAANAMGYPVMLKSTAGGGGIGMELCHSAAELSDAYGTVKRLSKNNFGNADLFLEKFVERARHVEVQVFGDGTGNVIALGERDCSAQRRNQKVIEETPAPNLADEVRNQMQQTAVALCSAISYRSAGTVEFIYDPDREAFYFLEVNTRLQVEHGVTEQVFGVDIVEWMVRLAAQDLPSLQELKNSLKPAGHAIQVRVYAEDPGKNFQPSAGLVSHVSWPDAQAELRLDHWIEAGVEVSPFFDPMLAKVIVTADTRENAISLLIETLSNIEIYGVETNIDYVQKILEQAIFSAGEIYTRFLNTLPYSAETFEVITPGTLTTIQDWPARVGYWDIGVPPSGPFDNYSFRLGNRLLGNDPGAAGLELTLTGPSLLFNAATQIVLTGAEFPAELRSAQGETSEVAFYKVTKIAAGDRLKFGKLREPGARAYLLIAGGIDCPEYMGSRSTFTLGKFGGHSGRALLRGDVIHFGPSNKPVVSTEISSELRPELAHDWKIHVIYGPHGAPDFFTKQDIDTFFAADWEVHYNSSRTGVRLIGPKPEWARSDGGEAGMHPSNIHDNAYAIGSIDFTGDMPVILGPDGPSLGGFVCPATVISADLWKLGQLKAGDKIRFLPVSQAQAANLLADQNTTLNSLAVNNRSRYSSETAVFDDLSIGPVLASSEAVGDRPSVSYRPSGDQNLLIEYGPVELDIAIRFRVHALMLWLQENPPAGIWELTPGIRSLQVHFDSQQLKLEQLIEFLQQAEHELSGLENQQVESRIVHLPLSWDDAACAEAVEKYMQSVRKDAPWCPSNIEFIRRINGLSSIDQVKQILFSASYVVMGLGDVYLGAPVATPLDPRHRLVTTKYNPARTWTAENSVGIGGSYLCIYGMEGPGGYQFVGRTLQMWNRYRRTAAFNKPWLLRFFDQIRFYEVSHEELEEIRSKFPKGEYDIKIEPGSFNLNGYQSFLAKNHDSITEFKQSREAAFKAELDRWIASGQINFESESIESNASHDADVMAENEVAIDCDVAGNVWRILVNEGDGVDEDQPVAVLESMKMEIEVLAPISGRINQIKAQQGAQVSAGQTLMVLEVEIDE